jgi:hypothetical protein
MLIVEAAQSFTHRAMMTARPDPWANNRWLAEELERFGYGAQSDLAEFLDVQPSTINKIIGLKRKIAGTELDLIRDWVHQKHMEASQGVTLQPSAQPARRSGSIKRTPVVGWVVAGGQEHRLPVASGVTDYVEPPAQATDKTVAVQIRGESLGNIFDRWYAFYDDVRHPMTEDLVGELCVVGLSDGRVLIKQVQHSRRKARYNLLSPNEKPIKDVEIAWAARVKDIGRRVPFPHN